MSESWEAFQDRFEHTKPVHPDKMRPQPPSPKNTRDGYIPPRRANYSGRVWLAVALIQAASVAVAVWLIVYVQANS